MMGHRIVIVRFHLCSKASGRQQRRGRREGLRDLLANATHILRLHGSVQEWTTAGLPEYQCSHDLGDVAGHRDDVHLVLFLVSDVSFADMWLTSTSAELIPIEETYINCAGIGLLLRFVCLI